MPGRKKKGFDTNSLVPDVVSRNIAKYLPYFIEIRNRFLVTLVIFIVAAIAGFSYYEKIVSFVVDFFSFKGVNVVFTTPFQFFTLALNCGIVVGVIIIIPVITYQILHFLKPALLPREFNFLVTLIPLTLVLFLGGFIYGVVMMKYVVQIFYESAQRLQIGNVLDVESLLSSVLMTGLLLGVAFLFPIVMTVLMHLNVIKHKVFANQRPIAYLIGVIFVIMLPPPDLLSDTLLFLPLAVLFELTLILNRVFLKTHLR